MTTLSGITISRLAKMTGCTAEAIRYYERAGVVPNSIRRGTGRYRLYDEADVQRFSFLRRARELGFSLAEVKDLITLADGDPKHSCATVDTIARTHLAQIDAKLAHLTQLRHELARVIEECAGGMAVADCRIMSALGEKH